MELEVRTQTTLLRDQQWNTHSLKVFEESCSNVLDAGEHTAGILELFR